MIEIDFGEEMDLSTTYKPEKPIISEKQRLRFESIAMLRKEEAAEIIAKMGGVPKAGNSIDIISNGQSNAGGFYEVIRDIWGTVDELCIATWIINREYIDMLTDDIRSGRLKHMTFVISNRMSQLGRGHGPNFNRMKSEFMQLKNIDFRIAISHSKTYSMTNGVDYITVDGSGNWSKNPRIENYTITNDKSKFEFRKKWMQEVAKSK